MFLDDFESAYSANNLDDQEGKEQEAKAIEEEENAAALAANGSNEVPLQIPDSGVLGEISPSLPNVPDVPVVDGQNPDAMSDTLSDHGSAPDSSSSEDNVPLDQIRRPQVARRKSRAQPPQAVDLSEDDLDSEDENCPAIDEQDDSDDEGDGESELYEPLGLDWTIGGDDLPEPDLPWKDGGTPSFDAQPPPDAMTCFLMLFSVGLLEHVVQETNRYGVWMVQVAVNNGNRPLAWQDTSVDELCKFFGLIVVYASRATQAHVLLFVCSRQFFFCDS